MARLCYIFTNLFSQILPILNFSSKTKFSIPDVILRLIWNNFFRVPKITINNKKLYHSTRNFLKFANLNLVFPKTVLIITFFINYAFD